eukprot:TRINITY_DN5658_c0_g1_i2.p1 TRINITY_DN5658_c0_g1~~TRINITY_DN5658_c0_g1_i2.p1  ORF type:complete len:312 (+),score=53.58 TRINITY_DN5658_c0_g1_i2:95-937(+)
MVASSQGYLESGVPSNLWEALAGASMVSYIIATVVFLGYDCYLYLRTLWINRWKQTYCKPRGKEPKLSLQGKEHWEATAPLRAIEFDQSFDKTGEVIGWFRDAAAARFLAKCDPTGMEAMARVVSFYCQNQPSEEDFELVDAVLMDFPPEIVLAVLGELVYPGLSMVGLSYEDFRDAGALNDDDAALRLWASDVEFAYRMQQESNTTMESLRVILISGRATHIIAWLYSQDHSVRSAVGEFFDMVRAGVLGSMPAHELSIGKSHLNSANVSLHKFVVSHS